MKIVTFQLAHGTKAPRRNKPSIGPIVAPKKELVICMRFPPTFKTRNATNIQRIP